MFVELVDYLSDDETLAGLLADAAYDAGVSGPAIYSLWSPDHPRPYVTISWSEDEQNEAVFAGELFCDVWITGTDYQNGRPIVDRLVALLDHAIVDTSRGPVRFFQPQIAPEQDEDPDRVRWRVTFQFRRSRGE